MCRSTDVWVRYSRNSVSTRGPTRGRSTRRARRPSRFNFPFFYHNSEIKLFFFAFAEKQFCGPSSTPTTTVPAAVAEERRKNQKLIKFTLIKHNTSLLNAFLTRNLLSFSCISVSNQWRNEHSPLYCELCAWKPSSRNHDKCLSCYCALRFFRFYLLKSLATFISYLRWTIRKHTKQKAFEHGKGSDDFKLERFSYVKLRKRRTWKQTKVIIVIMHD